MSSDHFEEQKRVTGLDPATIELVRTMRPALEKHADEVVTAFYERLNTVEEARTLLDAKPGRRTMLHGHLRRWLIGLSEGSYEEDYRAQRYSVGKRHVDEGVEPWLVIAAMAFCRSQALAIVEAEYGDAADKMARGSALSQVMDLDLNIMLQSYDDKRIQLFLETTGFSRELFEQMIRSG